MELREYSTSELMSEIRRRDQNIKRMCEEHYERKCKHCMSCVNGVCGEIGVYAGNITGCIYFRKDNCK